MGVQGLSRPSPGPWKQLAQSPGVRVLPAASGSGALGTLSMRRFPKADTGVPGMLFQLRTVVLQVWANFTDLVRECPDDDQDP